MKRIRRISIGIALGGLLIGLILWLFGVLGPFYRTEVAMLPINLQSSSQHQINFTMDRPEEYLVEVHLKQVFSKEKMNGILGDFVAGGGGKISIRWVIDSGGTVIAQGSSGEFGYSPIFSRSHSGLTIGAFEAEKDHTYTLTVTTINESSDWNKTEPYIEVGLHPNKLESYLGLQIFGFIFIVVFGVLLLVTSIMAIRSRRSTASNNSLQPTAKSGG